MSLGVKFATILLAVCPAAGPAWHEPCCSHSTCCFSSTSWTTAYVEFRKNAYLVTKNLGIIFLWQKGIRRHRSAGLKGNIEKSVACQMLSDAELFWLEPAVKEPIHRNMSCGQLLEGKTATVNSMRVLTSLVITNTNRHSLPAIPRASPSRRRYSHILLFF